MARKHLLIRSLISWLVAGAAILMLVVVIAAAGRADSTPASTAVGGPIISDTTWTLANSPYVVTANIQVMTGVTLTVQPGVMVKFSTAKLLQVDGTLIARGSSASPITFTSNLTTPQPGDWGGIYFTDGSVDARFDAGESYQSGSVLQYCVVEYAGNGLESAIHATAAAQYIDHCTVRNNKSRAVQVLGTLGRPAVVSSNTLLNNACTCTGGGGLLATYALVIGNVISGTTTHNSSVWEPGSGGGLRVSNSLVISNTVVGNRLSGSTSSGGGG